MLEILVANGRPTSVGEILSDSDIEPTLVSQHLAVLKRHDVARHQRVGKSVYYQLAHPKIAELLLIARYFLADRPTTQRDQMEALASMRPLPARER